MLKDFLAIAQAKVEEVESLDVNLVSLFDVVPPLIDPVIQETR